MTETQPAFPTDFNQPAESQPADTAGGWEEARPRLRDKFPEANTDGVLFCIYKLQQDPMLSLRDFRDEAKMHGLSVAGRSLHSAKVALGLQAPARRRSKAIDAELSSEDQASALTWDRSEDMKRPVRAPAAPIKRTATKGAANDSLEDQMIAFAQGLQNRASEHGHKLRSAMKDAIRILQDALDDTE